MDTNLNREKILMAYSKAVVKQHTTDIIKITPALFTQERTKP